MGRTSRRGSGSGSVFQRSQDGMWVARVELPPDTQGRRRRRQVVRARRGDAVTALRDLRRELDRTGDLPTASPTLAQWLTLWLDRIAAPTLKPRTAAEYAGHTRRYLVPVLGAVRLDKLTTTHVYRLHEAMTARGLSTTTQLQAHRILAKALADAEREGRVGRNVAALATAPRRQVATMPALTADQARTLLLSTGDGSPERLHWALALLGGLRQGERLGLTADSIDLTAGTITVAWQLQRLTWHHGCGGTCPYTRAGSCPARTAPIPPDQEAHQAHGGLWLTRPKSRTGWREVPLAPPLAWVLAQHLTGRVLGPEGLVLTRPGGLPIDPSRDAAHWAAALAAAGLPHVPLHSARHTCSSLLAELGVPEHVRMQILGHSSATVTRGYTHLTSAEATDAMTRLGRLIDWR